MGIDLLTFTAQIINLFVLMWLLKRFLYRPVLKMVEERQTKINARIEEAVSLKEKAEIEKKTYENQIQSLQKEKESLLEKARKESETLKETLSKKAKVDVEKEKEKWSKSLLEEQKSFKEALQGLFVQNFKTLSSKALKEISNSSLSNAIFMSFKEKLSKLDAEKIKDFRQNALLSKEIIFASDLAFSDETIEAIQSFFIQKFTLPKEVHFTFEKEDNILCGIEVSAGERNFSWSLNGYLETFSLETEKILKNLNTKKDRK
ncbi:MAG: hypothetical protein EOM53_03660 [Alphaproteobacteria bacterium]|nr:hypothetical protein [Alphaproteobacteria bacterium]